MVVHFFNVIATSVFSLFYYQVYIVSMGVTKDVQNRIDALQDFQTTNGYFSDQLNIRLVNHLMDLFTSLLQLTVNNGGYIYFVFYFSVMIIVIFDLNFREFFVKQSNFLLVKFLTLFFLLIPPFGIGLWEHHTIFVVLALLTIVSSFINLNYYIALLLAVFLDPLAVIFVYLKAGLQKKLSKNWVPKICLLIVVIFTLISADKLGTPSNKFQFVSLLFLMLSVFFVITNNFIVRPIQIELFLLIALIFCGVSGGWNPTNRVFIDYLIFFPVLMIIAFKIQAKRSKLVQLAKIN